MIFGAAIIPWAVLSCGDVRLRLGGSRSDSLEPAGCLEALEDLARLPRCDSASAARPCAASHSACSSRVTASQKGMPSSRNRSAAAS
jgi:hypothetical protein